MSFGSLENGNESSTTLSEINMVPLIDVMLVLLVIFMITAPLLNHSIPINLPKASSAPVNQDPVVIDVAINSQGQVFWNEEAIQIDSLASRLGTSALLDPQPELRIRADLNTRYEVLAQIMGDAKSAGLNRLAFITRPADNNEN